MKSDKIKFQIQVVQNTLDNLNDCISTIKLNLRIKQKNLDKISKNSILYQNMTRDISNLEYTLLDYMRELNRVSKVSVELKNEYVEALMLEW